MKINHTGYDQYIKKVYQSNKSIADKPKDDETGSAQSDRIELSDSLKQIKKYLNNIKESEVNLERVDKIKNDLASGTYRISSEELADHIIQKMKE